MTQAIDVRITESAFEGVRRELKSGGPTATQALTNATAATEPALDVLGYWFIGALKAAPAAERLRAGFYALALAHQHHVPPRVRCADLPIDSLLQLAAAAEGMVLGRQVALDLRD